MGPELSDYERRKRIEDWERRFDRGYYGGGFAGSGDRYGEDWDRDYPGEMADGLSDPASMDTEPYADKYGYQPGERMDERGRGEDVPFRARRSQQLSREEADAYREGRSRGDVRRTIRPRNDAYVAQGSRPTGGDTFVHRGQERQPHVNRRPYEQQGPYQGVGPADYTRSDERIMEEVNERLTRHGQVDARKVSATVMNGVVTLSGTVNTRRERRLAEEAVESVSGVKEVQNWLMALEIRVPGRTPGYWGQRNARENVRRGMEVFANDGERLGRVKHMRGNDFLVDRPLARDVYVPYDAIEQADERVVLNIASDQLSAQDWENPDLF